MQITCLNQTSTQQFLDNRFVFHGVLIVAPARILDGTSGTHLSFLVEEWGLRRFGAPLMSRLHRGA